MGLGQSGLSPGAAADLGNPAALVARERLKQTQPASRENGAFAAAIALLILIIFLSPLTKRHAALAAACQARLLVLDAAASAGPAFFAAIGHGTILYEVMPSVRVRVTLIPEVLIRARRVWACQPRAAHMVSTVAPSVNISLSTSALSTLIVVVSVAVSVAGFGVRSFLGATSVTGERPGAGKVCPATALAASLASATTLARPQTREDQLASHRLMPASLFWKMVTSR